MYQWILTEKCPFVKDQKQMTEETQNTQNKMSQRN